LFRVLRLRVQAGLVEFAKGRVGWAAVLAVVFVKGKRMVLQRERL
jgi:hypothetical protein